MDAQDKASENNYGNYENSSPTNITSAVRFFFIFPDAVCEAVEHRNLLLGRYKTINSGNQSEQIVVPISRIYQRSFARAAEKSALCTGIRGSALFNKLRDIGDDLRGNVSRFRVLFLHGLARVGPKQMVQRGIALRHDTFAAA